MAKRRIFIAYIISKELQKTITEWRSEHADLPVRWMQSNNLHTTLVPPWYEENVQEVISRLQTIPRHFSSFPICLRTISSGQDKNNPHLIWAKGETPQKFMELKKYLFAVLKKEEDKKIPLLHVTLARFNKIQRAQFSRPFEQEEINWTDTVDAISLIESHLQRTGSVYEMLATIRFE